MAEKFGKNVILFLVSLGFLLDFVHSDEQLCLDETPCFCRLSEEKYIDLGHIPEDFYTFMKDNLSFFFHPCKDAHLDHLKLNLTVKVNETACDKTSLCMYNATDLSLVNLGTTAQTKFTRNSPKSLVLTAEQFTSTLELECVPHFEDTVLYLKTVVGSQNQLRLFSRFACEVIDVHDLSFGSKLLVMLAVCVGVYLVGGALVLHLLRGAQGKEMIPNLEFWIGLPLLVRDGLIFLLSGCNPMSITTAESYDRI